MVTKTVSIREDQADWVKDSHINLSRLLQSHIDEQMKNGMDKLRCKFCGGALGETENQKHSNPNYAEFKTCKKCDYQWAKAYWQWLRRIQSEIEQEFGKRKVRE